MTIKKPMKAAEPAETAAAPVAGGATIADRFKLDLQDPSAKKAKTGVGTLVAVIAGFAALAVAGILAFVIYQHWEFLQAA